MSIIKKIFASNPCYLSLDLSKRWFVSVKVPNYKTGRFVWRKVYGDINKFHSIPERLNEIERIQTIINETGEYITIKGSRKPGFVNQNYYTDTVFQIKRVLALRRHRIRESSMRKFTGMVKNLERWLIYEKIPNLPVGAFQHEHAMNFLGYLLEIQRMSNESYSGHLQLLKSLFNDLIKLKIITDNPFDAIRKIPKENTPALYFTKQQMEILKNYFSKHDPQLWFFVQFIYYGFVRPGELRQMKISEINFDENKIRIVASISKNRKLHFISIPRQLRAVLDVMQLQKYPGDFYVFGNNGYPGKEMLSINSMKNRHQKNLKTLGFDTSKYKLYSWKHSGAVACARAGMNLKDLQMQLRHHSLDQVNAYLNNMLVYESEFIKNNFPEI
ncbi:MAG: tyrosine-type recombinase/integrase [Chitinophagaceae bacterium]|nr:tyrosine-type recombinase/integrase [Chitinophagaceae bacterium]